jgi:ABC-type cobalt transport system substrate-binding protein
MKRGRKSSALIIKRGKTTNLILLLVMLLSTLSTQSSFCAAEKWPGVDEAVVKKIAKEQGREARDPLIPTDQGDLLLFVFLLAGVVGGFIAGYYWRVLMVEKGAKKNVQEKEGIN